MDQLSYLHGLLWTQTVLVNCYSNSQVDLVVKCKFVELFFQVVLLSV